MEAKFTKGQRVRVTRKNGEVVEGTVAGWDCNLCTFEREYDINYLEEGESWSMICVPEERIYSIE